jgi:stage V sporulation protein R
MPPSWEIDELQRWDARIRELAAANGLDCYPQEFEICDHTEMLAYMAYSGMPSHYPHWSYGKAFERFKTLYDHGVTGLPYEMVINANPALAYLMRDNSLPLQILTIAHVYGHNDFFKNNFTFRSTRAEYTLSTFKSHADRVRRYQEDPSIGLDRVESVLDAAHALALQCRRNLAIRKLDDASARQAAIEAATPRVDPFRRIHRSPEWTEPELRRSPAVPDEDLLLFIRDHNRYLAEWERDILTIVHERAQYFIPQIETKIMNEGWASYWHKRILDSLELDPDLHLEFLVRHNQVVRPHEGAINPYHLGIRVWEHVHQRAGGDAAGDAALFSIRESDRDSAFLRRHLDEELVRALDLFRYQRRANEFVITDVADPEGWRTVRDELVATVGMNGVPVIRVVDGDAGGRRTLALEHVHDGRDLHPEYAERTLAFVHRLWQREVTLDTLIAGKRQTMSRGDHGFTVKAP